LRKDLEKAGVQTKRYKVIDQIREKQPFNSLEEIPKAIKGISQERMLKLIENWLHTLEV